MGAQLWVSHRGREIIDVAIGDAVGAPMTPDTVHNCYCMSKPLMGLEIALLWSEGRLDPTEPLARLDLPDWARPPFECSVLDVLDHRVGLDDLPAMEYRISPAVVRPALVRIRIANASPRPAYSEILGGIVLEEVVRAVTGCTSVADEITSSVLEPLGAERIAIHPEPARGLAAAGQVGAPFGGLPLRRVPLLFEMLDLSFAELRPAFGVLCSARDIGRLLEQVRRIVADDHDAPIASRAILEQLLTPRHAPFHDRRAGRTISAAGGFMVDMNANALARHASARSYGHNGGMAAAWAFTDVDHDLTIALYLNGAEAGAPTARMECLAIVDDVYRGLGLW